MSVQMLSTVFTLVVLVAVVALALVPQFGLLVVGGTLVYGALRG